MSTSAQSPGSITTLEGGFSVASHTRFAVVASRFNELVVEQLLSGALATLAKHGVTPDRITVVRVPGAWELPLACQQMAKSGRVHGVVALGCVIRGGTPHFDYVAGEAARGLAAVSLETGVPVGLGVLTTNTLQQALERVDESKVGHRGVEATLATLQMVALLSTIGSSGAPRRAGS
jgi:6,7-dimethyl-8-ribityllumazine synthase